MSDEKEKEQEKEIRKPNDELSLEDLEKVQGGQGTIGNAGNMIHNTTKNIIDNIRS